MNDEIEEMRIEARKASSVQTFTLKQLLTTPELKLPIIIACVSQVAQQWSGINAVSSLLAQFSEFRYLLHQRAMKAQASLSRLTRSPDPSA